MAIKDVTDLSLMLDSNIPIIVLQTHDEEQALELLTRVAMKQSKALKSWTITRGLDFQSTRFSDDESALDDPNEILESVLKDRNPSIYALCDFHPYLTNQPEHVRLLKDIALSYRELHHNIVLISHELDIPPELKRLSAKFELSFPTSAQLISILREEIKAWSQVNGKPFTRPDPETTRKIISNLKGLSVPDARRLIRSAIFEDGALTDSEIPAINKAKFELLDMNGVISFEYDTEKFSDVGGLVNLKEWILQREEVFMEGNKEDKPRGVMLLGIQGGGKSLAAKAVAGLWGVTLLRLDMGALYNKYIAETEKNLRVALEQAEIMSPCVLWIDEIEKAINTDGDSDVSHRVLGALLTWMSENKERVFVVSTANDISQLPPELMRKGRMDEIFFVDLPKEPVRHLILQIHMRKRQLDPASFDLNILAEASEGFS